MIINAIPVCIEAQGNHLALIDQQLKIANATGAKDADEAERVGNIISMTRRIDKLEECT